MTDPKSFFTDGAAYERLMGRFTRAAGDVFLDWLALPKQLNWLDVGCGTGAFTQLLLDRCTPRSVAAIDPSEEQIAYARTTPMAERVDFRVGDAQTLPFADGTFDAAVMALVIAFVPDPQKALAEMRRVAKPGAMLAAYMWDVFGKGLPQQPLREAVEAMGIDVPLLPGYAHSRMDNMQGYFSTAGLDDIGARTIEIDVIYADFDDYWSAQTALTNHVVQLIQKMNIAEVERLKAHLRASLPKDERGRIAYKAKANAVKGRVPA